MPAPSVTEHNSIRAIAHATRQRATLISVIKYTRIVGFMVWPAFTSVSIEAIVFDGDGQSSLYLLNPLIYSVD